MVKEMGSLPKFSSINQKWACNWFSGHMDKKMGVKLHRCFGRALSNYTG
jgi:hypothetical protein